MNDDEIDTEEDENGETFRHAYPFNIWGQLYNLTLFGSMVAQTVSTYLGIVASDFASHNNEAIDRRKERQERRLLMDDLESFERGDQP